MENLPRTSKDELVIFNRFFSLALKQDQEIIIDIYYSRNKVKHPSLEKDEGFKTDVIEYLKSKQFLFLHQNIVYFLPKIGKEYCITGDFIFKEVLFQREGNLDVKIVENLVNSILEKCKIKETFKSMKIVPTKITKEYQDYIEMDFLFQDSNTLINIEVQQINKSSEYDMYKRWEYYMSCLHSKVLEGKTKKYELLNHYRQIQIIINKFENPNGNSYIEYHKTKGLDDQWHFQTMQYILIYLGSFKKKAEELKTSLDYWLFLFTKYHQSAPSKYFRYFPQPVMQAYHNLFSFTLKSNNDPKYNKYNRMKKEGVDIGIEMGMEIGMERGMERGVEKGRQQILDMIKDSKAKESVLAELEKMSISSLSSSKSFLTKKSERSEMTYVKPPAIKKTSLRLKIEPIDKDTTSEMIKSLFPGIVHVSMKKTKNFAIVEMDNVYCMEKALKSVVKLKKVNLSVSNY